MKRMKLYKIGWVRQRENVTIPDNLTPLMKTTRYIVADSIANIFVKMDNMIDGEIITVEYIGEVLV